MHGCGECNKEFKLRVEFRINYNINGVLEVVEWKSNY